MSDITFESLRDEGWIQQHMKSGEYSNFMAKGNIRVGLGNPFEPGRPCVVWIMGKDSTGEFAFAGTSRAQDMADIRVIERLFG